MSLASTSFEEAIGPDQDTAILGAYVHILGADQHSGHDVDSYSTYPEIGTAGGIVYSYERWIRVRFDPGFVAVRAFRFFSPTLQNQPAGWQFSYGVSDQYQTPVNTPSIIAVSDVPYADPGRQAPNAGGEVALDGTDVRFSKWIVLQARIDTDLVAGSGPAYGYNDDSTPALIEYDFFWTESE